MTTSTKPAVGANTIIVLTQPKNGFRIWDAYYQPTVDPAHVWQTADGPIDDAIVAHWQLVSTSRTAGWQS
jgi:hypothetical protein